MVKLLSQIFFVHPSLHVCFYITNLSSEEMENRALKNSAFWLPSTPDV
jgi:hypothetical protein